MRRKSFLVPIITEWKQYVPSFGGGWGTNTGVSFWWRQNGSSIEISGKATSGTVASAALSFDIPTNIGTIDTNAQLTLVGICTFNRAVTIGAANFSPLAVLSGATTTISLSNEANGSVANNFTALDGSTFMTNTTAWGCFATVRMGGWRANRRIF